MQNAHTKLVGGKVITVLTSQACTYSVMLTTACYSISRVTNDTGTCEAAISVTAVSIHMACMITNSTFVNI